jgi:hypothetical protein
MEERILNKGNIVRHFKWESDSQEDHLNNIHLYRILDFATHSETKEKMVIYKSLYSNDIYVRPYDMFMSEVDHEKYPDIKQKYRFELINDYNEIAEILARYYCIKE